MPGTICSPLARLCAQRMPGLTNRPSALVHASVRVEHLIAIVERHVADARHARRAARQMLHGECEARLALPAEQRPFLGEAVGPRVGAAEQLERADVLHDAGLLIVGLLDQEAVVRDRGCLRRQPEGRGERAQGNGDPGWLHRATSRPVPYMTTSPASTPSALSGDHSVPCVSRATTRCRTPSTWRIAPAPTPRHSAPSQAE